MPKLLTGAASPVDIPDILDFWERSRNAFFSTVEESQSLGTGVLNRLINRAFGTLAKRNCSCRHIFVRDMAGNPATKETIETAEWAWASGSQIITHDLEYPMPGDGLLL